MHKFTFVAAVCVCTFENFVSKCHGTYINNINNNGNSNNNNRFETTTKRCFKNSPVLTPTLTYINLYILNFLFRVCCCKMFICMYVCICTFVSACMYM